MKKIFILLVLLALCASTADVFAQRRGNSDDEYFDESGNIGHRIWFGSHFNLGYSGNGFESLFQAGLSPMVGFKINDIFSIGPRASVSFSNYRRNYGGGDVEGISATSWAVGVFGRVRPFPTLFAQLEYDLENEPFFGADPGTGSLTVVRQERGAFYIGGGYNSGSGGPIAFEVLLMYNVNQPNTLASPLDFRFGITYRY